MRNALALQGQLKEVWSLTHRPVRFTRSISNAMYVVASLCSELMGLSGVESGTSRFIYSRADCALPSGICHEKLYVWSSVEEGKTGTFPRISLYPLYK